MEAKFLAMFKDKMQELRSCVEFEQIIEWITTPEHSALLGVRNEDQDRRKSRIKKPTRIKNLTFSKISYGELSNSHSCPVGGVTNFERDPTLPLHYLGWSGRITFDLYDFGGFSSNFFRGTGINLGSGSGDGVHYGADFKMFANDWYSMACLRRMKTFDGNQT